MRRIAILGSTGSIGTQSLDVIRRHAGVVLRSGARGPVQRSGARGAGAGVFACGGGARLPARGLCRRTTIVNGASERKHCWTSARARMSMRCLLPLWALRGCRPCWRAIECGKTVLLANKEALVTGGALVMEAARRKGVSLLPVDSEHSAIFQCIQGRPNAHPLPHRFNSVGGAFPHLEPRADRAGHGRAGAAPSELVHGPQDHHRQRLHGQQGPGGHRGALAL